jgi:hypothetical protein
MGLRSILWGATFGGALLCVGCSNVESGSSGTGGAPDFGVDPGGGAVPPGGEVFGSNEPPSMSGKATSSGGLVGESACSLSADATTSVRIAPRAPSFVAAQYANALLEQGRLPEPTMLRIADFLDYYEPRSQVTDLSLSGQVSAREAGGEADERSTVGSVEVAIETPPWPSTPNSTLVAPHYVVAVWPSFDPMGDELETTQAFVDSFARSLATLPTGARFSLAFLAESAEFPIERVDPLSLSTELAPAIGAAFEAPPSANPSDITSALDSLWDELDAIEFANGITGPGPREVLLVMPAPIPDLESAATSVRLQRESYGSELGAELFRLHPVHILGSQASPNPEPDPIVDSQPAATPPTEVLDALALAGGGSSSLVAPRALGDSTLDPVFAEDLDRSFGPRWAPVSIEVVAPPGVAFVVDDASAESSADALAATGGVIGYADRWSVRIPFVSCARPEELGPFDLNATIRSPLEPTAERVLRAASEPSDGLDARERAVLATVLFLRSPAQESSVLKDALSAIDEYRSASQCAPIEPSMRACWGSTSNGNDVAACCIAARLEGTIARTLELL